MNSGQDPSSDAPLPARSGQEPAAAEQLEREIYQRADELARLLGRLPGSSRKLAQRAVIEAVREASAETPAPEAPTEPRSKENFGGFGLLIMFMGLLFIPVIPPMATVFLSLGTVILVLSFLVSRFSTRRSPAPEQLTAAENEET